MSYLGSTPTTQNFIAGTDQFTGNGSTTNWTLSRFVNSVNDIEVVIANVVQNPTSYSVSGNTLTISPAVTNAVVFYVRYLTTTTQAIAPSQGTVQPSSMSAGGPSWDAVGNLSDGYGNVRSIPINSKTGAYVLLATDNGKCISITTGGVTVPASVLSAGQVVTIYNNSGSSQTITQGSGLTLQWAGQASSTTGNRTIGLYGMATVLFITATNAVITGSGLT